MSGTGLKKCSPTNCFGRAVAIESSVMVSDEVFDAKIASFFTIRRAPRTSRFLTSAFSMMASMTMSQSARSSSFTVPRRQAKAASRCRELFRPYPRAVRQISQATSEWRQILCRETSGRLRERHFETSLAATCAMPEPMRPQPRTPTFWIFISSLTVLNRNLSQDLSTRICTIDTDTSNSLTETRGTERVYRCKFRCRSSTSRS